MASFCRRATALDVSGVQPHCCSSGQGWGVIQRWRTACAVKQRPVKKDQVLKERLKTHRLDLIEALVALGLRLGLGLLDLLLGGLTRLRQHALRCFLLLLDLIVIALQQ